MASKKDETASFVLRFTQKIFEGDNGEPQVQWRGNIRHVQSGDETRFGNYEEATTFVQGKLADLTLTAVENKSPEIQKGIVSKSLDLWKKMATATPKIVMDSIKDPKKQVAHLQEQIQEQIDQVGGIIGHKIEEKLGHKLDLDQFKISSKSDFDAILEQLKEMSGDIKNLNKKIASLEKKVK